MKRDQQKSAVHKGRMEGNRWIEGVWQKQKQGRREGIKWRGGGLGRHMKTDRDYFKIRGCAHCPWWQNRGGCLH